MTLFKKCPFCGAVRMLIQEFDGIKTRTCFSCFMMSQWKPDLIKKRKERPA